MLYKRLKQFRVGCGFTQQQVADVLSIDRSTYAYYETGRTSPDIDTVSKLVRIFGIDYRDLLGESSEESTLADGGVLGGFGNPDAIGALCELTREEKQLILYYRLLSAKQRSDLLESMGLKLTDDKAGHKRRKKSQGE